MGINIPREGTRGRSIALPELSSLREESTNTYFGEVRGCRGGCGDYPPQLERAARKMPPGWQTEVPTPPGSPLGAGGRPEADASLRIRERAEAAWKGPVVTH